jgi:CheY-like chemotaxis protein
LIDGFGEKDKKDKIAPASIYKQFGNNVGILIAGVGPMAIPKSASSSRRKGAEILIADENPATLEFFSRLLEDNGFTTLTADSGEAVLQLLIGTMALEESWEPDGRRVIMRPLRRPISVILIGDLMKPPVDGLDLIRRLRPYHIPLVVATSYGPDYTLLAKMAGAENIIHKFADPTYVITTIEEALQERLFPPIPLR